MKKKMKKAAGWLKRNMGQLVMLILYILMGAGCGIIAAQATDEMGGGMLHMLMLAFTGLYFSLLMHIVLHEAGHMIFGLATGYRFSSFRLGSMVLGRTAEGKLQLGWSPLPGAGGQCLMSPPDMKDGKMPFVLYNLGGAMMNLIISLLCLPGAVWAAHPLVRACCAMGALTGLITAATNGIPMRVGVLDNDGRNILTMKKNPEAVRALWVQLKAAEQNALDVRLRDMPEEWFSMPSRQAAKNSLSAGEGVFYCGRLMDQMRLEEALGAMNAMMRIGSGMVGLHRVSMKMDMACCELLLGRGREAAERTLDKNTAKIMKAMKSHLSAIRTGYILALLGEEDEKKAQEMEAQFEKAAKKWPSKADVESERELMEKAKEAYCAGRPEHGKGGGL